MLGFLLAFVLLAGMLVPATLAAESIEFLNPLAEVEPVVNMRLAERGGWFDEEGNPDLNGKVIALSWYSKETNSQALASLGVMLKEEFPDVIIVSSGNVGSIFNSNTLSSHGKPYRNATVGQPSVAGLASAWNAKSDSNYNVWGGVTPVNIGTAAEPNYVTVDAVIFGIADCNVCTWWSSYHQRRVEALGVPTVAVTDGDYETTQYLSALDNGISNARRAPMNRKLYAHTYGMQAADFTATNTTGTANDRNDRLIRYFVDVVMATPNANQYNEGLAGQMLSPYEQVKWALTEQLSDEERNPSPISPAVLGSLDKEKVATLGATYNASNDSVTFTASSYAKAQQTFNDLAEQLDFQDGLPLIIPTPERVNEMLAATTRARTDVLGKMKMRNGVITVEKVAINAVMAGAQPEYFPVILAAMEMWANGWDDDMMWYHTLTSGGWYSLVFVVSGPISEEIGLVGGRGYDSSGNEANLTIGRTLKMCHRNIGLAKSPNIDTSQRQGRPDDHTLTVISEQTNELPAGWVSHSEEMGFPAGSSTITLNGYMNRFTSFGGEPNAWTVEGVFGAGAFLRNFIAADISMLLIPPAMAQELSDAGYTTKLAFRDWLTGSNASHNNANRLFPIVAGGDPGYIRQFGANPYSSLNTGTQLITGATLTAAGSGITVPSAPTDFNVIDNEDGSYTLRWKAPVNAAALATAGAPITHYQVTYAGGQNLQTHTFVDSASDVSTNPLSPSGINPGQMVHIAVEDLEADADGYYCFTYEDSKIQPGTQCFFHVRALNSGATPSSNVREAPEGLINSIVLASATNNGRNYRASGRGGWTQNIIIVKPGFTVGLNAPYSPPPPPEPEEEIDDETLEPDSVDELDAEDPDGSVVDDSDLQDPADPDEPIVEDPEVPGAPEPELPGEEELGED